MTQLKFSHLPLLGLVASLAIVSGCTEKPAATLSAPSNPVATSSAAPKTETAKPATAPDSKSNSKKINVNTATNAELDKLELPGTKPSLSERIEGARPYKDTKELVSKKAISEDEFKLIENLITVEDKK